MNTEYGWKELYIAALRETDWRKMEGRIRAAEVGIKARLQELSMNHGGTHAENREIKHALNGLKLLQKDLAVRQSKSD